MPTTVALQGTVAYGAIPLWILFFILISPLIKKRINKKKAKKAVKEAPKPAIKKVPLSVKEKYVVELNRMLEEYETKKRDEKESYQLLSHFLREFFHEYAGIDVTRKTLAEIRGINNPKLERLVEEFYACEFAPDVRGNIKASVERTIKEINNW